jgi:predicted MFS family arabinose efflux permease
MAHMTTTATVSSGSVGRQPTFRTWLGVLSLSLGAAVIVTSEFVPVGFLPAVAGEFSVSLGQAGMMVLIPGLAAAIAAPLVIVGAANLDRRLLVITLTILVLTSNVVAALAPDFIVVLAARVFLGIAIGGFWAVVPSLGVRLAGPEAAARAMAIIVAGLSAGTVIGLPAGQFLGSLIGWRWTFAAAAAVALLIAVVQVAVLPKAPAAGRITFGNLAQVFRVPLGRAVLIAGGLVTVGQFAASTFVTPLMLQKAHLGSGAASVLFLGYGLAGVAGTLLGGALVARSKIWTFVGAAASFGVVLVLLPIVSGFPPVVSVLVPLWGLIWGLVPLALQTLMLTATPQTPEASSAMFIALSQLAIAVGAALGGVLVDSAGLTTVFVVSGVIAVGSAVFGSIASRKV